MKELATRYNPAEVEDKWYAYWMEHKLFSSKPDSREPYTIVIPPPNVTGVLHMGHMLNETIQDILIRLARMQGKNACWVPGTDHASIATETKVIAKLAAEGIKKTDLTREEFLEHAWDWTRHHGGIILQQLRKLGASCDWDRTAFTMDPLRSEAVTKVFCDLYEKGLIYRGLRMVNWDPVNRTAISDDEVYFVQEQSKLYYLRYYLADGETSDAVSEEGGNVVHVDESGRKYAVVATTRPETIMGDTAMCINPKDPKNHWLKGKKVVVPLVGRVIPVIEDRYVEVDFGTGCLKVTPAHDKNDFMLGNTHNLPSIDIFNEDATVSDEAGMYVGMDRFEVREKIAEDLKAAGLMEKIEDYVNNVGFSERTKVPIEPRLSLQWFVNLKHFADFSLSPVMDDIIKFVPEKYKTTYRVWLENIQDWCISRQLWWGHRIPAYYYRDPENPDKEAFVVAESITKAVEKVRAITGRADYCESDLTQDPGALDTWFSSWLWPITLFDGINNPGNEEISYYYPTATLVTGPDIIFFWVARMIMAGYEFTGKQPFKNVYFTGIVRDSLGRKMSKSLGNSPDPIELMANFGADGVRLGLMLSAPAGNDILFDEKLCETGRNFSNKLWNVFRLIAGWHPENGEFNPEITLADRAAIDWMRSRLAKAITELNDLMEKFRISEAANLLYRLIRDDFSSSYLEMVKPAFGTPVNKEVYETTVEFLDALLRLLHPFMPFITEEIWQNLEERRPGESLMVQQMPVATNVDESLLKEMDFALELITGIRGVRASKNLPQRDALKLLVIGRESGLSAGVEALVMKLANISEIEVNAAKPAGPNAGLIVDTTEFAIPLADNIDLDAERAKIEKEIEYHSGFLSKIEAKLANERFVSKAPANVIEAERRKQADTIARLSALKAALANLG
ncbi:MAG: valine--tRNA ligase [Muribaculaceae bacterium]|nr:valine--tRNA ligase [Muribaculaceae bacterium]